MKVKDRGRVSLNMLILVLILILTGNAFTEDKVVLDNFTTNQEELYLSSSQSFSSNTKIGYGIIGGERQISAYAMKSNSTNLYKVTGVNRFTWWIKNIPWSDILIVSEYGNSAEGPFCLDLLKGNASSFRFRIQTSSTVILNLAISSYTQTAQIQINVPILDFPQDIYLRFSEFKGVDFSSVTAISLSIHVIGQVDFEMSVFSIFGTETSTDDLQCQNNEDCFDPNQKWCLKQLCSADYTCMSSSLGLCCLKNSDCLTDDPTLIGECLEEHRCGFQTRSSSVSIDDHFNTKNLLLAWFFSFWGAAAFLWYFAADHYFYVFVRRLNKLWPNLKLIPSPPRINRH